MKRKVKKPTSNTLSDRFFLEEVRRHLQSARNNREEAEGYYGMIINPYYKGLANRALEEG